MRSVLHITSGDIAGSSLAKSGIPGEVFVWHDILYEGPRRPGWPDDDILRARARFLEQTTGGGLSKELVLKTLRSQYCQLKTAPEYERLVLWFDACLFDQSMLAHILACLRLQVCQNADLLCVDAFPGIEPFDGLGQLRPAQLASLYDRHRPVTDAMFSFAERVDHAFALQDRVAFDELAACRDAPLPWVPAAVARWLQETPDAQSGLGRLERLVLEALRAGVETPRKIFSTVSAKDTHPQFWGDTTLWAKINALANRQPPLVRIDGPTPRLPQWDGMADLNLFTITGLPNKPDAGDV